MSELRIATAEPPHVEDIAPLFDPYRRFYGEQSDLAGARAYLAERLRKGEAVIYSANEGDAAVGFTLFVSPDARRGGVGRAPGTVAHLSSRPDNPVMVVDRFAPNASETQEGPIVLADISGYTTFVATTELEHSRRVVALLLESMIESQRSRLEAGQVAGDAVLFVGVGIDPAFLSWVDDMYVAFHRMARDLAGRHDCGCRACEQVPTLTMKALAHYGRWNLLRVGPSAQVHGRDAIVPHRLAKNSVPSHEYVLVTPALAEHLSATDRQRFAWREENAAEFGAMRVGYYDLGSLRYRAG